MQNEDKSTYMSCVLF